MLTNQHIEEGLSRAYVQIIAARAGISIGSPHLDYGIDGTFSKIQIINKRRIESGFKLDYQLKASISWELSDNHVIYDIEAKTYNDIIYRSREDRAVPVILILMCLPKNSVEWLENSEDHLLLRKCCYWTIFTGDFTDNFQSVRIRIPREQILTPGSLISLLESVERGDFNERY
jgi:hypothetical protein